MFPRILVCSIGLSLLLTLAQSQDAETTTVEAEHNEPLNYVIDRSSHHPVHDPTLNGFWRKKFSWRSRWVKTWQARKIYVAVWKKMWGPVVSKEWVPVPRPPPGWVKHDTTAYAVRVKPH